MKILFRLLAVAAFALLGFYFYIIGKNIINPPTEYYTSTSATSEKTAAKEELPDLPGEKIFKNNCSACHKLNGKMIGPALAGVNERYAGEEEWLYKWIQNAPRLIAQGDPKAVALYEEYNKQQMQAFPGLSEEEIDQILEYIEVYGGKGQS